MSALKSVESIWFQSEADSAHNDYDMTTTTTTTTTTVT